MNFQFTIEANDQPPIITPIDPVDGEIGVSPVEPIHIKLTHETGINLATLSISVNGINYVIDGAAVNGASFITIFDGDDIFVGDAVVSSTEVNVTLRLPAPYPSPGLQTVSVAVENLDEGGGGGGGDQ